MADEENRPSIFDLYAKESDPIPISDGDKEVLVKFTKRTERQRLAAEEYGRTRRQEFLEGIDARRKELRAGPFGKLTREQLVATLMAFRRSQVAAQGLDLFDDIDDESGETVETVEDMEKQRGERLEKYLEERKEELEELDQEALLDDLVETSLSNQLNIQTAFANMDMTIVLTCLSAESGEPLFASTDDFLGVQPEIIDMLRGKLNEFIAPETEKEARRLANDPNSSGTTD